MKIGKSQKFKAKIRISRISSNNERDLINITVHDENFIEFFDGVISVEDYGYLISGFGVDVDLELRDLNIVNRIKENKKIEIQMPKEYGETYDSEKRRHIALKAVKPFEIDGWKAELNNISNSHYYKKSDLNPSINFVRYVDKEENKNG